MPITGCCFSYCQTCDTQCTIDNAARRRPQVEGTLFKILLFLETRGASPFRFGSPFLKHSHQKGCLCHANCLMATVADGRGVDGVWCMGSGGGSGLWLESSSNSPSVSNVSFSHQLREQAKNSSDQLESDGEKKRWKSERTREKGEETLHQVDATSFCQYPANLY